MRILVPSSGGREFALAKRFASEGHEVLTDHRANPGWDAFANRVNFNRELSDEILSAAERRDVTMTVIGGETMLKRGVVNLFEEAGRSIVGPTGYVARLETSKWQACKLLEEAGVHIPQTRYCEDHDEVRLVIAEFDESVIKPDGDTLGKGVFVVENRDQREAALKHVSQWPGRYLVQERIHGREISFFVAAKGLQYAFLGSAADYKKFNDLMTGGTGGYAPHERLNNDLKERIFQKVVEPVLDFMDGSGRPYRGVPYFQFMDEEEGGIWVIGINVRFGDPEAQLLMPLYEGSLAQLLYGTCKGRIFNPDALSIRDDVVTVCQALMAQGYPTKDVRKGDLITGLEAAKRFAEISWAGIKHDEGRRGMVTDGGRVLYIVGRGRNYMEAMAHVEDARNAINFEGMAYNPMIAEHLLQVI